MANTMKAIVSKWPTLILCLGAASVLVRGASYDARTSAVHSDGDYGTRDQVHINLQRSELMSALTNVAPLANETADLGSYQVSQDQVRPYLDPGVLSGAAGANLLLNMGNNEPTIAVDPNNSTHLAVATYLRI